MRNCLPLPVKMGSQVAHGLGHFPECLYSPPKDTRIIFSGPLIYPSFYEVKNEADDGLAKV